MSRIKYPLSFDDQLALLKSIIAKHTAEGTGSVLLAFLTQKEIDLAQCLAAGGVAQTHENSHVLLTKQSQNFSQLRDLKFGVVYAHTKSIYQFLKSFYNPNLKALGDWGAPIDTNGKISYPTDLPARVVLFKNLKTKHESFPAGASPLNSFLTQNLIDLTADDAAADQALAYADSFQQASKAAENETETRDLLWLPVNKQLHAIGDYLKKFHTDNSKTLGLWGFVVDNSVRQPKERTSTIKPGDDITTAGIVLGSTLTNIGKTDIHIYAGRDITGSPSIVRPNEAFGILRGHSIITVRNPSLLETAKFTVLVVN